MTTARQTPGEPAELDALVALAPREHRAGRLAEAAAAYRQILALRPDIAEAHNNLGIVLSQQGNYGEAQARFEQALALRPDNAEMYNNLGSVLLNQGKIDEAVARYERALALRPNYAQAHYNLGNIHQARGEFDQAAARYQQALAFRPDYAQAHYDLGNVLRNQGKLDEAAAHFEQTLALWPDNADAHNNLGDVLLSQNKFDEAAACFEQALALRPGYARAHYNLGLILWKQGKLDEATARYGQALALQPDYAKVYYNLGIICWEQGKFDEAAARFEQALALWPDHGDAHCGRAAGYLAVGDYERGWPAYEGRLHIPGLAPQLSFPRWTGEPLAGRSLLLVTEQGLGDTFQFVRYARLLKERGARVVLACPAALGRLLAVNPDRREPAWDELFILGSAEEPPRCDFYLPLLSAPFAFRTSASTIPCEVPYLWADPELTAQWGRELAEIDGFKIGIAWQGSRDFCSDRWRSIPLAQFAPLARLPGVRLVSLQKGLGSEQVATVDFPLLDLSGRIDGAAGAFMDTAAVLCNLDLVVTSCTAIAHLAGGLGVPVWVALHYSPDWRWLRGREDSPWYPTMRLFRQTTFHGWPDVFQRMAEAVPAHQSKTA
jgi:tetratricopeptide (TPR) repeat protein